MALSHSCLLTWSMDLPLIDDYPLYLCVYSTQLAGQRRRLCGGGAQHQVRAHHIVVYSLAPGYISAIST